MPSLLLREKACGCLLQSKATDPSDGFRSGHASYKPFRSFTEADPPCICRKLANVLTDLVLRCHSGPKYIGSTKAERAIAVQLAWRDKPAAKAKDLCLIPGRPPIGGLQGPVLGSHKGPMAPPGAPLEPLAPLRPPGAHWTNTQTKWCGSASTYILQKTE